MWKISNGNKKKKLEYESPLMQKSKSCLFWIFFMHEIEMGQNHMKSKFSTIQTANNVMMSLWKQST